MLRRAWVTVLMVAVLAACGGTGTGEEPAPSPEPEPTDVTLGEGEAAADALESFTCRADGEGVWSATGVVKNTAPTSESYQVAVLVSDTEAGNAKTTTVESIQPDEASTFEIAELPVTGEEPTCRVTVVRLAR
ncbi:hypothetical protein D9V41_07025 [Aeromicrobium phragmitis]|uniref:Ig-like domain-containing protein n=1 Tax=Aeromicrobium phragmitis TaxID=2478914 RepID=A0A3L8PLA7_9ACTN|nr:hypothetical protein [Aeromicrobium phragmitis]RLV56186.1 hypothetical protein D9V41_07025 [Aeromicrobium phragmitis]